MSQITVPHFGSHPKENKVRAQKPADLILKVPGGYGVNLNRHVSSTDTIIIGPRTIYKTREEALKAAAESLGLTPPTEKTETWRRKLQAIWNIIKR